MDTSDQLTRQRRLRTNEEKRQIVEEATAAGASVASVARKHGVNANLVFGWIKLHKRGVLAECREPASLVPVAVTTPTVLPDRASRPARVVPDKRTTASTSGGFVELCFPDGVSIRVRGRVDRDALAAIVAVLRKR